MSWRDWAELAVSNRGEGRTKHMNLRNLGNKTAENIVIRLEHNGQDWSRLLRPPLPELLHPNAEAQVYVHQGPGPSVLRTIVEWTDHQGDRKKFYGTMVRVPL